MANESFSQFLLIENLVKEVSKKMKMKKLIKSFQSGLEMLAKSTYGDINWKYPIEEEQDPYAVDPKKRKPRKSYGHLKVVDKSEHL